MMFPYFKYLEDYNDSIHEFVFEMVDKNLSGFFKSFYSTCKSMIINDVDLSDKQIKIIEREMEKRKIKIPQLEDYEFKITIPLKFEYKGKAFDNKAEIGDLIYLLNQNPDFNSFFESLLFKEK